MKKIELIATATFGLEVVVARGVQDLGYETEIETARVIFRGVGNQINKLSN
jgi:putative N6-adenine-specific DNA methylase